MQNLFDELRNAAKNLVTVAQGLRFPLDTSTFENALAALEDAVAKHLPKAKKDVEDVVADVKDAVAKGQDAVKEAGAVVDDAKAGLSPLFDKINKTN